MDLRGARVCTWAGQASGGGAASLHTAPHSGPGLFMCRWARAHTQAAAPAWCAPPPPGRWLAEAGSPQRGGWALNGRCAKGAWFCPHHPLGPGVSCVGRGHGVRPGCPKPEWPLASASEKSARRGATLPGSPAPLPWPRAPWAGFLTVVRRPFRLLTPESGWAVPQGGDEPWAGLWSR